VATVKHRLITYDVDAVTWEPVNLPGDDLGTRLHNAWFNMGLEGLLPKALWERFDPYRELSVEEFARIFNSDSGVYLFRWVHQNETIGYLWFDHLVANYKAHVGIAMLPEHWGSQTPLLIERFRESFHDVFKVPYLFALTPWRATRAMLAKTGFDLVTTVDHFTPLTHTGTVWVYRSTGPWQVEAAEAEAQD
jgi:hypothetical protein